MPEQLRPYAFFQDLEDRQLVAIFCLDKQMYRQAACMLEELAGILGYYQTPVELCFAQGVCQLVLGITRGPGNVLSFARMMVIMPGWPNITLQLAKPFRAISAQPSQSSG